MKLIQNFKKNAGEVNLTTLLLVIGIIIIGLFGGKFMAKFPFFVLAAILGLSAFVLCFVSFKLALYMLIFSMLLSPEFGERTTEGGGATIRLDDLLLVLIAFGWLARTSVHSELSFFRKTSINKWIFYYVCSCVFSTMVGMMFGRVDYVKGFFFVIKYIEYFVVYFVAVNYIHEKKQISQFLFAMLGTFFIVLIVAIAQVPAGGRITAPFEGKGGEPNTLGGYAVLMVAIVIGLLLNLKNNSPKKYKAYLILLVTLSVLVILFSRSRGSWLAIMPMLFTLIVLSKKRVILIICLVIFGAIFPIIAPSSVKERFAYTFQEVGSKEWADKQEKIGGITLDTSTSERVSSWRDGFEAWGEHLILGYGITGWRFLDAQYIKTLVEQGAIGLITFLGMLYVLLKSSYRVYINSHDEFFKGISLGFVAGIVGMVAHGLSTNTFIIVRIMEPFWFLAAIVMAIPDIEENMLQLADGEGEPSDTNDTEKGGTEKQAKSKLIPKSEMIRRITAKKK